MKSLRYILLGIILLGMLIPGFTHIHRGSNGQILVMQATDKPVSETQLNASADILSKRLKSMDIKHFQVVKEPRTNQLLLKVPDEVKLDQLKGMLLARGRVNFYPVIVRREALASLTKQPVADCINKVMGMLNLDESESFQSDFMLGLAMAKDTATINHCLNSDAVSTHLAPGWRGLWSVIPDDGNQFALQMVNTTANGITEQSIGEAKAFSNGEGNNGISLNFKRSKWESWKQLTAANIDKALAIVIDGKVYSAPIVRSEIGSGKAQITGSFSPMEARMLAAVISSGALPVNFIIK